MKTVPSPGRWNRNGSLDELDAEGGGGMDSLQQMVTGPLGITVDADELSLMTTPEDNVRIPLHSHLCYYNCIVLTCQVVSEDVGLIIDI